jgi:hypothetical protein
MVQQSTCQEKPELRILSCLEAHLGDYLSRRSHCDLHPLLRLLLLLLFVSEGPVCSVPAVWRSDDARGGGPMHVVHVVWGK